MIHHSAVNFSPQATNSRRAQGPPPPQCPVAGAGHLRRHPRSATLSRSLRETPFLHTGRGGFTTTRCRRSIGDHGRCSGRSGVVGRGTGVGDGYVRCGGHGRWSPTPMSAAPPPRREPAPRAPPPRPHSAPPARRPPAQRSTTHQPAPVLAGQAPQRQRQPLFDHGPHTKNCRPGKPGRYGAIVTSSRTATTTTPRSNRPPTGPATSAPPSTPCPARRRTRSSRSGPPLPGQDRCCPTSRSRRSRR